MTDRQPGDTPPAEFVTDHERARAYLQAGVRIFLALGYAEWEISDVARNVAADEMEAWKRETQHGEKRIDRTKHISRVEKTLSEALAEFDLLDREAKFELIRQQRAAARVQNFPGMENQ